MTTTLEKELAEALEWALEQIEDDLDLEHREALEAAKAALAKAKGTKELILGYNSKLKTVCLLPFQTWEEAQMAFRYGIEMPDGNLANGIGRAKCSFVELLAKIRKSSMTMVRPDSKIL